MVVSVKMTAFWDIVPCRNAPTLLETKQCCISEGCHNLEMWFVSTYSCWLSSVYNACLALNTKFIRTFKNCRVCVYIYIFKIWISACLGWYCETDFAWLGGHHFGAVTLADVSEICLSFLYRLITNCLCFLVKRKIYCERYMLAWNFQQCKWISQLCSS
jgi:hypothetical protein